MEPPGRRKQRRAQWRFMKVDVQRVAEEDPRDETVTVLLQFYCGTGVLCK